MSSSWTLTICCLGAGYVGGSTMAVIAAKCPTVRVLVADTNAAKIAQWNSADLPIFEPQLPDLVAATRDKNLFFHSDIDACIRDADIVFICVDTPTKQSGLGAGSASDTSKCEDCARRIAQVATASKIIVEKSTVPVRTADALKQVLGANSTGKIPFEVVSNPEFLAEGSAVDNLLHPNRVLIGGDATPSGQKAVDKLVWLYSHWIPRDKILTSSVWSSELAKLVANACLAQRLSSINSISAICEATGANVHEVAKAVGADDRIGAKFLDASLGFGGSSFQKDVLNLVYLAQTLNLPEVAAYWKRVVHINDFQKTRFVKKILESMFNTVANKRICLFGFAYKQNTSDTRETVAASVIKALLTEQAVLAVYDPYVKADEIVAELERQGVAGEQAVKAGRLVVLHDAYEAARMAHAVVVITEFDGMKQLDFNRIYDDMAKPAFFFDGRNALPHRHLVGRGAQVHAIGQGVFR